MVYRLTPGGRTVAVPLILGAAQVGLWRIVRRRFPGQPTSHLLVLGTAFLSLGVLGIVAIATGLWRPVWRSSLRATDYDGSLIAGLPTANAPRSALRETRSRPRAASRHAEPRRA
jgi:hypothetical protein